MVKTTISTLFILILGVALGNQIIASADHTQGRFTLDCTRYDTAELYLMCEQAKAAKDMAIKAQRHLRRT